MDTIKALAQAAWKLHPNNKNGIRCPSCKGNRINPVSGKLGGPVGTVDASGALALKQNASSISLGALVCKDCKHVFSEEGEA